MLASAIVKSMLASAVLAWGVPAGVSSPASDSLPSIFESDPALNIHLNNQRGQLDKEIIRRVIRGHIDEVKSCYEEELSRLPNLGGRILVQFTIAASGQVIASVLQNSTMNNPRVETCAVDAVRRWQFPKPRGGGVVIVSYPFVLTPAPGAQPQLAPALQPAIQIFPAVNGAGGVEIETITPTLYVHRSTNAGQIPSNGLIAVAAGGLLLVDTAWTEAQTDAILAWGDQFFRRPWIGAVITHDHNDRAGGLAALQRRHIPVSALDLTVAKLTRRGVHGVAPLFAARDGAVKDARGFEAFYPGAGHASDNIVLHFPGLTYGGCLVKSLAAGDLGFTGDADLAAWPAAVRNVSARYNDATIVPGHGPVDRSGRAFAHTLELLAAAARAQAAKK